ncbi:MAG: NUDIX domain-containing protein [Oscillospiraceae bacterium]|nr:NUDIX domain-containing protein [Oscillospiraceae bacterium]
METFDLYDAQRCPTGETMLRGTPTPPHRYRLVIHISIFNTQGQLLIQQRQTFKDDWSNMWDLSVGGSVTSGETSQTGAERELEEELGVIADLQDTVPAASIAFRGGFDDHYILIRDLDLSELHLQYEEVQAAKWASKEEILSMIDDGRFIPYHKALIELLFFLRDHQGTHTHGWQPPKT